MESVDWAAPMRAATIVMMKAAIRAAARILAAIVQAGGLVVKSAPGATFRCSAASGAAWTTG